MKYIEDNSVYITTSLIVRCFSGNFVATATPKDGETVEQCAERCQSKVTELEALQAEKRQLSQRVKEINDALKYESTCMLGNVSWCIQEDRCQPD